jgi:hypothetical protein
MKTTISGHVVVLFIAALAAIGVQQAATQTTSVEIGRGECGNQVYFSYIVTCAIPFANRTMTLQVVVLRQISSVRCVSGVNFGLAADNSYMWTSGGCNAEFSIRLVGATTTATTILTTATATTTTPTTTALTTTAPTTTAFTIRPNPANCGETGGSLGLRIIGGSDASNCQFPWMVLVYNQRTQSVCGGTIISNSHILTAAHCFVPDSRGAGAPRRVRPNELLVYSGSSSMPFGGTAVSGLRRRPVLEITAHEGYNNQTLENDIAILRLREPIVYDTCHKPLCLVDGRKTLQQVTGCRTMGWGLTSNTQQTATQTLLQYVDLPVVADDACRGVYGSLSSERTFCAGASGQDACQGDSGGPFTCREPDGKYYIYGIVSAGISRNCGNLMGIYTKVSAFLPWITQNTN